MLKRKGKNETIITQDQGEKPPNKTNLLGATRIKGIRIPKGVRTTNAKGGTKITFGIISLVLFSVSMAIILTIFYFKQMKDSMNVPRPPASPTPQQTPQQYLKKTPPMVLKNPIPHQGVMNT
jgi:hypothetical protein